MITHLKVDGFRSLSRFEMTINPGLNILVGPNGSGKTNIVSFLQFLSYITLYPLSDAVARAGGAGSVFQKIGSREYQRTLTASIDGFYTFTPDRFLYRNRGTPRPQPVKLTTIRYLYTFELSASPDLDIVLYQSQTLAAWKSSPTEKTFSLSIEPDLRISTHISEDAERSITVDHFDPDKFKLGIEFGTPDGPDRLQLEAVLKNFLGRPRLYEDTIFSGLSSFWEDFRNLRSDFTGGEIFNIIPSQVRSPEDSAKAPIIQSDGSGLAATLFALQKNMGRFVSRHPYAPMRRELPSGTFPQIIKYLQTVNEAIVSLNVTNDPFDNKLKVAVNIAGEKGVVELPFSSMSDGTVKWASLITAILTYETIFAIEEPENFLHPLMQREILKIMRENVQRRGGQSFVVMTTHSETLLNAADPGEIVVVSIANGVTHTERPEEPERIRAEIQRTGFGLGYFYISGALDNA